MCVCSRNTLFTGSHSFRSVNIDNGIVTCTYGTVCTVWLMRFIRMSEAIGIMIKIIPFSRDRVECAVYCTFFSLLVLFIYMYMYITWKDSLLWHLHAPQRCTVCVRSFVHFATLNSNAGAKILLADWRRTKQQSTIWKKPCLFYSAFLLFVCLYPFYALSIQSI